MSHGFNFASFSAKLRRLTPSIASSIEALASYIEIHAVNLHEIATCLTREFPTLTDEQQLGVVYVLNQLWQVSRKRHGEAFINPLIRPLERCIAHLASSNSTILHKVKHVLDVFEQRGVVSPPVLALLRHAYAAPMAVLEGTALVQGAGSGADKATAHAASLAFAGEAVEVLLGPEVSDAIAKAKVAADAAAEAERALSAGGPNMPDLIPAHVSASSESTAEATAALTIAPSPVALIEGVLATAAAHHLIAPLGQHAYSTEQGLDADAFGLRLPSDSTGALQATSSGTDVGAGPPASILSLLSRLESVQAALERAELAATLTRQEAQAARALLPRVFVLEEQLAAMRPEDGAAAGTGGAHEGSAAGGGVTDEQRENAQSLLLEHSGPIDAGAHLGRVTAHLNALQALSSAREAVLQCTAELLDRLASLRGGGGTGGGDGEQEPEEEEEGKGLFAGLEDGQVPLLSHSGSSTGMPPPLHATCSEAILHARKALAAIRSAKRALLAEQATASQQQQQHRQGLQAPDGRTSNAGEREQGGGVGGGEPPAAKRVRMEGGPPTTTHTSSSSSAAAPAPAGAAVDALYHVQAMLSAATSSAFAASSASSAGAPAYSSYGSYPPYQQQQQGASMHGAGGYSTSVLQDQGTQSQGGWGSAGVYYSTPAGPAGYGQGHASYGSYGQGYGQMYSVSQGPGQGQVPGAPMQHAHAVSASAGRAAPAPAPAQGGVAGRPAVGMGRGAAMTLPAWMTQGLQ